MRSEYFHDAFGGEATEGDIANKVLLISDPMQIPSLAATSDVIESEFEHYEFVGRTCRWGNQRISICSTGLGGGSASIAVDNLASLGGSSFLYMHAQPEASSIAVKSYVQVALGAARLDGASLDYVPIEFPAAADPLMVMALCQSVRDHNLGPQRSIFLASSRKSAHEETATPGSITYHQRLTEEPFSSLVLAQPEVATILTLATLYRLRAGAMQATLPLQATSGLIEVGLIDIAIDAYDYLSQWIEAT